MAIWQKLLILSKEKRRWTVKYESFLQSSLCRVVCGLTAQENDSQAPVTVWKSLKTYGEGFCFSAGKKQSYSYLNGSCRLTMLVRLRKKGGSEDVCISKLLQFQGYGSFGSYTAKGEIPVFIWPLWWPQMPPICTGSPLKHMLVTISGLHCHSPLLFAGHNKPVPSSHFAESPWLYVPYSQVCSAFVDSISCT